VCLDGEPLDFVDRQCRIPSLRGRLTVFYQDGKECGIPLFEGSPLIFKQRKNWGGEGRRINGITSGHFIFIAPSDWEWIGHVPVEPAACSDQAFRAHYFHRDATIPDEDILYFREWSVPTATGIELVGDHIFDDSDDGMLFVGDPPEIKSPQQYKWARVGRERAHGWGQNFQPERQSLSTVLACREGRFFVRVYDAEKMLDSVAFRYVRGLKRIKVNESEYSQDTMFAPMKEGYPPIEIRLIGVDGSIHRPILAPQAKQTIISSGAIKVPPHPGADRISCRLGSDLQSPDIILELPRIWWRLEDGSADPDSWRDTPLIMTREEFRDHAYADASLSILSRRETQIRAGFDDQQDKTYKRKIKDDHITIPLYHFADHVQISKRLNQDACLNVEWARQIAPLIVISADPVPEIVSFTAKPETIDAGEEAILEWKTKDADDAHVEIKPDVGMVEANGEHSTRPVETTMYKLTLEVSGVNVVSQVITVTVGSPPKKPTSCVMSAWGGWRSGKGFSRQELEEVGLTLKEAVGRSIPVDKRRRTAHPINIQELRRIPDAEYRN